MGCKQKKKEETPTKTKRKAPQKKVTKGTLTKGKCFKATLRKMTKGARKKLKFSSADPADAPAEGAFWENGCGKEVTSCFSDYESENEGVERGKKHGKYITSYVFGHSIFDTYFVPKYM
jgi:hypothetical protein